MNTINCTEPFGLFEWGGSFLPMCFFWIGFASVLWLGLKSVYIQFTGHNQDIRMCELFIPVFLLIHSYAGIAIFENFPMDNDEVSHPHFLIWIYYMTLLIGLFQILVITITDKDREVLKHHLILPVFFSCVCIVGAHFFWRSYNPSMFTKAVLNFSISIGLIVWVAGFVTNKELPRYVLALPFLLLIIAKILPKFL